MFRNGGRALREWLLVKIKARIGEKLAGDKTKTGEPDRSSVSEGMELEIRDIAEVAGISMEEVRQL